MPRSEPPERPTDQPALPTRCSSTAWNSESRCVTRPGARTRQSSASHIGSCAKPEPGRGRQHPRAPAMQPAPAPVPSGSTHLRSRLRPALTPVDSTRTARFPIDRPRARLSARCSLLGSTSTGRASTWPVAPGLGGHLRNERRAPKRYRSPALAQTRPLALRAVGEPRASSPHLNPRAPRRRQVRVGALDPHRPRGKRSARRRPRKRRRARRAAMACVSA